MVAAGRHSAGERAESDCVDPEPKHLRWQSPPPQWRTSSCKATPTPTRPHPLVATPYKGQAVKRLFLWGRPYLFIAPQLRDAEQERMSRSSVTPTEMGDSFLGNQDAAALGAKSVENICLRSWVSIHRSMCKRSQRTALGFVAQDLSTLVFKQGPSAGPCTYIFTSIPNN